MKHKPLTKNNLVRLKCDYNIYPESKYLNSIGIILDCYDNSKLKVMWEDSSVMIIHRSLIILAGNNEKVQL